MIKLKALYDNSPFGAGYTAVMSDGSIYCFSDSLKAPLSRGKYCGNVVDKNLEKLFTFSAWEEISRENLPKKPAGFLQDLLINLNLEPVREFAPHEMEKNVLPKENFLVWLNKIRTSKI